MRKLLQSPQRGGFTLIELLTVIAIIGILAAILIPTVGVVRKQAESTQCLSNLRQIGIAVRLFSDENKGMIVPYRGASDGGSPPQGVPWTEALVPYMGLKLPGNKFPQLPAGTDYSKDRRFFHMCPSSPVPVNWRSFGNYSLHPTIMREDLSGPSFRYAQITRPSQVVLIMDGSVNNTNDQFQGGAAGPYFNRTHSGNDGGQVLSAPLTNELSNPNADGTTGWARYRHNGAVHCLFADAHVKAIKRGSLTFGNMVWQR